MIYLGCFVMTGALTLIMAHTAVAATVYPLLMAIYALYGEEDRPTKFGKGLFLGMAFTAGAGSIITLLGAARGAVAISFFKEITGREISFFQLTYYMLPIGFSMVFLLWGYFMIFYKPERRTIPGLRERAKGLHARAWTDDPHSDTDACDCYGHRNRHEFTVFYPRVWIAQ